MKCHDKRNDLGESSGVVVFWGDIIHTVNVSKNISFLFLFYDKKGLSLCCVCGMIGSEFQKDITLRKIRKIYGVKGRK